VGEVRTDNDARKDLRYELEILQEIRIYPSKLAWS